MFCVSDEVLNETVECTDGTVYLGRGLLKVRNIVEPEARQYMPCWQSLLSLCLRQDSMLSVIPNCQYNRHL